jgi:hypothetical protein
MDAATANISLTFTERQNLRYKRPPVAMDTGKPGAMQRVDKRLEMRPVSAIDYKHPGQPALDGSDTRSGQEREQDAIEPDVNDGISDNDPAIQQLIEAISDVPVSMSKRAIQATKRNSAGTLQVGQAEYNSRHGSKVAQYS